MERTRRLWAAVLCQAYEDLEREEFGSYWHNQAVAFFFNGGDWIESRRDICDMLGLHPHDLARPALRMINARRLEHGLPPLATRTPTPCPPTQRALRPAPAAAPPPLPRLVATFKEPEPEPEPKHRRTGGWRKRYGFNPFDPWRRLPSEERMRDSAAD